MKKLFALLCVLGMLAALCIPTMAAPEDGTITVYVDPFDDWTNISLYVWIDGSTNLAAWPGTAMTDADGDGWYELEIPAGYPNVIVAADGGNQTVDMTMDGNQDVWITLNAMEGGKGNAEIVYADPGEAKTDTSTSIGSSEPVDPPAVDISAINTLSLVGQGCDALNWEAGNTANEMAKNGNVYTKEIEVTAGSALEVKFAANGAWDIDFGGDEITIGQAATLVSKGSNMKLSVDADCTLKFTVDLDASTVLVEKIVNDPIVEPTEPSTEATEPSSEVTEPSSEVTEPSSEVTEPSSEVTEPSSEVTEPSSEVTEPSSEVTEPSSEVTEPSSEVTEPSSEVTDPTTEPTQAPTTAPTTKATDPTTGSTAATASPTQGTTQADIDAQRAKNHTTALIVIGVSLLVVVGLACVLSIPKKIT